MHLNASPPAIPARTHGCGRAAAPARDTARGVRAPSTRPRRSNDGKVGHRPMDSTGWKWDWVVLQAQLLDLCCQGCCLVAVRGNAVARREALIEYVDGLSIGRDADNVGDPGDRLMHLAAGGRAHSRQVRFRSRIQRAVFARGDTSFADDSARGRAGGEVSCAVNRKAVDAGAKRWSQSLTTGLFENLLKRCGTIRSRRIGHRRAASDEAENSQQEKEPTKLKGHTTPSRISDTFYPEFVAPVVSNARKLAPMVTDHLRGTRRNLICPSVCHPGVCGPNHPLTDGDRGKLRA